MSFLDTANGLPTTLNSKMTLTILRRIAFLPLLRRAVPSRTLLRSSLHFSVPLVFPHPHPRNLPSLSHALFLHPASDRKFN
eukprot:6212071-Pleurochrysis_carterae.AAC.4